MKRLAAAVLLLALAAPARAQVREYIRKRTRAEEPAPVALALNLTFSTTYWNEVGISTAGPVNDLSHLVHQGYYKLEIIQLVLISHGGHQPLSKTVERRRKGESLADIAAAYHLDYESLYESALAVQEIIDKKYLPLFPEKRPRKEREEWY